jgi:hypothetical protein
MTDQENQASRFARDMAASAEKMFKATQLIANTRDEDVNRYDAEASRDAPRQGGTVPL